MRLLLAAAAGGAVLFGSIAAAEMRPLSGFDRVSASAGTQVEIAVGSGFSVDVRGANADRVVTRVAGGVLIIEPQRNWRWRGNTRPVVHVTMPDLRGLDASSGARIAASGVQARQISLESSSGAHLNVAGTCAAFVADASSGAHLDASSLRCEAGAVEASSGARVRVH
ncbi:MAG: DUF2807 domain-containing protein, partial [Hyphomonadaceae bacterium]|nr:DUF2807 domain-containing protein [Hyphomonadaceae bacterium]